LKTPFPQTAAWPFSAGLSVSAVSLLSKSIGSPLSMPLLAGPQHPITFQLKICPSPRFRQVPHQPLWFIQAKVVKPLEPEQDFGLLSPHGGF
jgi:hypothetical protein